MSQASVWFQAIRPKTLTAALAPIAVGTALAYSHGKANFVAAGVALLTTIFLQIGTNLANDLFDHLKGADDEERLGPERVTSAGLVTTRQIGLATALVFALAFVSGLYLVSLTGWPLLALGIVCILSGVAYTGGPFPLAYNALGDAFVFVFFGLVAVGGTYYVQALEVSWLALVYGASIGASGVALLIVNNLRDIPTDKKHRKITTAVLLGPTRTRVFYVLTVASIYLAPLALVLLGQAPPTVMSCAVTLPWAVFVISKLYRSEGQQLNQVLGMTALLQLTTGLALALGVAL